MAKKVPKYARGHGCSIPEAAALDFKPWTHDEGEWTPPSNVEWCELAAVILPPTRVAWLTMFKTAAEIEEILNGFDDDEGKPKSNK